MRKQGSLKLLQKQYFENMFLKIQSNTIYYSSYFLFGNNVFKKMGFKDNPRFHDSSNLIVLGAFSYIYSYIQFQ